VFLLWGKLFFLVGVMVYIVAALLSFANFIDYFIRGFPPNWAVASIVWAILEIMLAAGSFFCFLLARQKLQEPFEDNDFPTLHRRLPLAVLAGVVFGALIGGVLYMLAYVKVDELPEEIKGPGHRLNL